MKEQHGFAQEQPGVEPASSSPRSSGEQQDKPEIAPGKKMDQNQQNQPGQANYTERVQHVPARPAGPSGNISGQGPEIGPGAGSNPDNAGKANNSNNAGTVENTGKYNSTASPLQRFGNYDLVRRIDMGGMGEVYLARQRTAFGREVAVKIIRSDLMHDITVRKRFLREAEVNAYLKHDHILSLVEFGEEKGRLFLVTPYIKGGTLSKRLKNGSLTLSETHELFTALVQAVAYLHKRGVIHRDLKPSNILLDQEEGSERVYVRLIDFGIASLQGLTASAPLTTAGHEMGTAAYMAPERLSGVAAPSNDIYSLGIILYQMLTGKLPADGIDAMLPEPLADVVQHGTTPNPTNRYTSADELLTGFERAYQSLSLSHFRVTGSNPNLPPVGRNIAANMPLATPKSQAPSSNPATPMPMDRPSRPPITPAANRQVGTLPDTPNLPNASSGTNRSNAANTLNSSSGTNMFNNENNSAARRSMPTARPNANPNEDLAQIKTTRLQDENAVERISRPSRPSNPNNSRPEIILPPLVSKGTTFSGDDYEAPTSYVDPQRLQRTGTSTSTASEHTTRVGQDEKVVPRLQKKKRGAPLATIITVSIVIIVLTMSFILYSIYQSVNTATITVMPRLQTISTTFDLTAKLGQNNVDVNAGVIPAGVLSSTKSASQQGNTTGQSDCALFFLNCKQSVSLADVDNLDSQIRPGVKSQIEQDIHQQEQAQGVMPVGSIVYTNETPTASPAVGTVSKTVTVTLSLQGSQEYIKTADAHTVATQKIQGQLKPGYSLIDTTLKIGQPVVQSIDAQGNANLKIAAAGVSRYQISQSEITNIQNHIVGKSQKDARAFIARDANLDPQNISIRLSYGDTLPGSAQQIKINEINPPTIPTVPLPAIPNS